MKLDKLFQNAISDKSSEEELFAYLLARFNLLARRKISNKDDYEEVVQSALLSIIDNYRDVEIVKNYSSWAFRILQNKIIDFYRTKKTDSNIETINDYTISIADDPLLKVKLIDCLQKIKSLNPIHFKILVLKYQGYSFDEICDKLKLTKNNSYSVLSRARVMLEHCLHKGTIK